MLKLPRGSGGGDARPGRRFGGERLAWGWRLAWEGEHGAAWLRPWRAIAFIAVSGLASRLAREQARRTAAGQIHSLARLRLRRRAGGGRPGARGPRIPPRPRRGAAVLAIDLADGDAP